MGFWKNFKALFKEESKPQRVEKDILYEDLEYKKEIASLNAQIKRQRKLYELREARQELKELREELGEDSAEDTPDPMAQAFLSIITGALNKAPAVSSFTPLTTHNDATPPPAFSDLQLIEMWDNTPEKYKMMARVMSDDKIREFINKQMPNADEDTINRALKIIRTHQ